MCPPHSQGAQSVETRICGIAGVATKGGARGAHRRPRRRRSRVRATHLAASSGRCALAGASFDASRPAPRRQHPLRCPAAHRSDLRPPFVAVRASAFPCHDRLPPLALSNWSADVPIPVPLRRWAGVRTAHDTQRVCAPASVPDPTVFAAPSSLSTPRRIQSCAGHGPSPRMPSQRIALWSSLGSWRAPHALAPTLVHPSVLWAGYRKSVMERTTISIASFHRQISRIGTREAIQTYFSAPSEHQHTGYSGGKCVTASGNAPAKPRGDLRLLSWEEEEFRQRGRPAAACPRVIHPTKIRYRKS
jgi:hypothetical protein